MSLGILIVIMIGIAGGITVASAVNDKLHALEGAAYAHMNATSN